MRSLTRRIFLGMMLWGWMAMPQRVRAEEALPDGEVMKLPAFVVEDGVSKLHWYYAELPGLKILSCCSKSETEKWVALLRAQVGLFAWELPPALRPAIGGPMVAIIDDRPSSTLRLPLNAMGGRTSRRGPVVGGAFMGHDFATLYFQQARASAGGADFIVSSTMRALIHQSEFRRRSRWRRREMGKSRWGDCAF